MPDAPRPARRSAADLVAEARVRTRALTPAELEAEREAGALIVDVREAAELAEHGVIPGAVHVPRGVLEFVADPESTLHDPAFDPARRTVLYCAAGGRSALAAQSLAALGFTDVAHLDTGFGGWVQDGRRVERAAGEVR